jgi:hypothetical protein
MEKQMSNEVIEFETYYDAIMDMIQTDGWKYLTSDLQNNAVNINSVEQTKDLEDLNFRKGQLNVMGNLFGLESQLQALRDQQDAEVEED